MNSHRTRSLGRMGISLVIGMVAPLMSAAGFAQAAQTSYHQVAKISLGGEGGWDYLNIDSAAERLYVTRGTHVTVVDTAKNAVVGDIPNTPGVHGVALAPKLHRGFTSNGRENTVTVFNLNTRAELQRIPVGQGPDAILYDPATDRVFTFNGHGNDVTALDAASGKVVGTIAVGGKPEFAATDEKGTVFCNIEDNSEIVAINARTLKVQSRWSIAPADGPSGLAIDRAHHRLFSVCDNQKMAVVDTNTGKVVATPAIGNGPDACWFDAGLQTALSSNGRDGTLTLVHEDNPNTFRVVGTIKTRLGARTMALDPKTHRIYLITATFKQPAAGQAEARRPEMEPNSAVILVYAP